MTKFKGLLLSVVALCAAEMSMARSLEKMLWFNELVVTPSSANPLL